MDINEIVVYMKSKFGLNMAINNIGYETVSLLHEELDENLVSKDIQKILPNPAIFDTYVYEDNSEWIIGIARDVKTNNPLFLFCTKNDEKIYQQIF